MSAIDGFYMGYWRPSDNFLDAWSDYVRDNTRATMIADKVGRYMEINSDRQREAIREATSRQIESDREIANFQAKEQRRTTRILANEIWEASEKQAKAIATAANLIGGKIDVTNKYLSDLNRRMDMSIEQQKLTNNILSNIAELLKIPNSEKERQQAITQGIKFFVNASKDEDLFQDALDNFLKAEQMQPQDYFVLHRIGCIYLYVPKLINMQKASLYFDKAAKYAAVESDPDAVRIANLLTNNVNAEYTKLRTDVNSIGLLAADSYNKAALVYYVMGDDEKAVLQQAKAVQFNPTVTNKFTQAKYLCREGKDMGKAMNVLSNTIDQDIEIVNAIPLDMDLIEKQETLDLLNFKTEEAENILDDWAGKGNSIRDYLSFKERNLGDLVGKYCLSK